MLTHLRTNGVAYVALFIALGGTSYAAVSLPRNSVGTTQLQKNAVTTVKVKNGTLTKADFKKGTLLRGAPGHVGPKGNTGPVGPTYGAASTVNTGTPAASPDEPESGSLNITLPKAGKIVVQHTFDANATCSMGVPFLGLYIDGVAIPETQVQVLIAEKTYNFAFTLSGVPAGDHTLSTAIDCPNGTLSTDNSSISDETWSAIEVGS